MSDDDLDPAALAAWEPDAPPDGFADRVLGGLAAPAATPPRRRGRVIAAFLAGALATAAATLVIVRNPDESHAAAGARATTTRESIALGRRGVAVAEAGASLAWHVDRDGAARIEQSAGDVFYRVERGGAFVVATAAGDVRVTGTCFRVEVQMKPSKSSVKGAAMGAALAAVVTVTVYEGGVVVAGGHGDQQVAAGERVVVEEGGAASKVEPVAATAPPPADVTREQLLARDATQRGAIATLHAKIAQLEHQLANPADGVFVKRARAEGLPYLAADDGDGRPWFDPSPELLQQFAAECRIRFDTPPVEDSAPFQLSEAQAAEVAITPDERGAINDGLRDMHERWQGRLIALYLEATGEIDRDRAAQMSPSALAREIEDKAADGEAEALRAQIARERAGLATPPTDLASASPLERYLRGLVGLGDEMEEMLAGVLGAERARALRELDDGWGSKHEMSGCAGR